MRPLPPYIGGGHSKKRVATAEPICRRGQEMLISITGVHDETLLVFHHALALLAITIINFIEIIIINI